MTTILELLAQKSAGQALTPDALTALVNDYTAGHIPDYQMSAWLMAVYLKGMTPTETAALTAAMQHSGTTLTWTTDQPLIDKHSTGGVGDKVSLVLVPLLMAVGVLDPMVSGRGLGHTGGTLDKLASIPGFNVQLSRADFQQQVLSIGGAIVAANEELAPADRRLYALRDATATVASLPLIASSIMSKKLATGITGLVLDVKVGNGALLHDQPAARALAHTLVTLAQDQGLACRALLTDMNQPLGYAVGNALEVAEVIGALQGQGPSDLMTLTLALGSEMVMMAKLASDYHQAQTLLVEALASGEALAAFKALIVAQGGDARVLTQPERLPQAPYQTPIYAPQAGYLSEIDTQGVGLTVAGFGGGRLTQEDTIDAAVGLVLTHKLGAKLQAGDCLAVCHTAKPLAPAEVAAVTSLFTITDAAPLAHHLIYEVISS